MDRLFNANLLRAVVAEFPDPATDVVEQHNDGVYVRCKHNTTWETEFGPCTRRLFVELTSPVVLLALVKMGILDYQKLTAMRRYMVVVNLVLGALLTTPEVFTQIVMAVVLQFLFEISVWIAWYWERRDRKRALQERNSA